MQLAANRDNLYQDKLSPSECSVNRLPRSWIAIVAMVAAFGVLFVLMTPAPDELPSTGPHSLDKAITVLSTYFSRLPPEVFARSQSQFTALTALTHEDLLSFTCVRLC
jgi:hypothetical protein